jgi:hypothetical protein
VAESFVEQVVLALEVQIDNALRQPCFCRYVADGRISQAFARNTFYRSTDQLPTPFFTCCGSLD